VQTLLLGPYVWEFLQEHALEEKLGDSIWLIYNTPVLVRTGRISRSHR
jgi:hypothetical protein